MKHSQFNLFLISECLNGHTKVPVHTFIDTKYDTAKLYFHDWINGKKCKAKFQLYKIAEIDADLKVKETKTFITSGFEYENKKVYQNPLFEEKKQILEASKENTQKEIIKKLFNGREIEC